jgi:hypothetical protein
VVLSIAKQFDDISIQHTTEAINAARADAGFSEIEDTPTMESALQLYVDEVIVA